MTDDSKAEKAALANAYPQSRQLLCFFHVLQKEWRWLCEKKNGIPLERRQFLMNLFRKVMYSETEDELNMMILNFKQSSQDFPNFINRFEKFYLRSHEWLYVHRKNIIIRGNNTNNYAEASIRILKDIILHRTKGYNCVALVDFICFVWEEYFKIKLLDYAHDRRNSIRNNYLKLCSRMVSVNPSDLCDLGNNLYKISSTKDSSVHYTIDVEVGLCSCPSGINGAFCKHQAYLHKQLNIPFVNAPAVTCEERKSLGKLALGLECPSDDWFMDLTHTTHSCNSVSSSQTLESDHVNPQAAYTEVILSNSPDEEKRNKDDAILQLSLELDRVKALASEVPSTLIQKFTKKLQKMKNFQQLYSALNVPTKTSIRKQSKIKVQPTAISRRRPGVTRGSTRIPSGRPFSGVKNKVKRKHNIKLNILANQSNAVLHGRAH
ncbi:uncharacterized protein LOC111692756 [Anoplophora glabripennis]|nr:uncharacterized protein LOC111692756 [Anoplophora glabripennis]XP_023312634.1 uncharacterized protein LOC111692756 [Anoplophora glabripennis]